LHDAGLTELNISTGDQHQQKIPFEYVVNAAINAIELGIRTVVVVEHGGQFKLETFFLDKRIEKLRYHHANRHLLSAISNIWIPFHFHDSGDSIYENSS
jgi:hypothetical protein